MQAYRGVRARGVSQRGCRVPAAACRRRRSPAPRSPAQGVLASIIMLCRGLPLQPHAPRVRGVSQRMLRRGLPQLSSPTLRPRGVSQRMLRRGLPPQTHAPPKGC